MTAEQNAPARGGRGARKRILDAAAELFYREGINATGVDRLAEAGQRPGSHPPDVIGDFGERDGDGLRRARHLDHCVVGRQRLELVRGGDEGQVGDLGNLCGNGGVPALLGVQPGADCRAALRQFVDLR